MAKAKPTGIPYDLYLVASVDPRMTGLPFVIHISERQGSAEPWVSAAGAEGPAIVSIAAPVRILDGRLATSQLRTLAQWIAFNRDVLMGYWDRSIESTSEAIDVLKPVPSLA